MARVQLPMTSEDHHLSLPRLVAFALPHWPLAAIGLPVAVFLPPFYAGRRDILQVRAAQPPANSRLQRRARWETPLHPRLDFLVRFERTN